MKFSLIQHHMDKFVDLMVDDEQQPLEDKGPVGKVPRRFAEMLNEFGVLSEFSDDQFYRPLTRDFVKKMCAEDSQYSDEACIVAILAWGGMKISLKRPSRSHAHRAWECRANWLDIFKSLRAEKIDRKQAYDRFWQLRVCEPRRLNGMGPAYYTKLIFFGSKRHNGLIMDQWTGRSINLLVHCDGAPLVNLLNYKKTATVRDSNCADTYEKFCKASEFVANTLGVSPEQLEMRMFAKGGSKPWPWRKYTQANFHPADT